MTPLSNQSIPDKSISGNAGAGWLVKSFKYEKKARYPSAFGLQVANLLGDLFGGIYHMDDNSLRRAEWENERRIAVTVLDHGQFGTFDFAFLTRLVFLAHDYGIKASIEAASPKYLRLVFWHVYPAAFMRSEHPSLEEALESHRKFIPAQETTK